MEIFTERIPFIDVFIEVFNRVEGRAFLYVDVAFEATQEVGAEWHHMAVG